MGDVIRDLRKKEQEMVMMEAVLEQDFANSNLERACNRAYMGYYKARQDAADKIVSITGASVDKNTALRMIDTKAAGLEELLLENKATA